MNYTFKGNFGTLEMIVDSKGNAMGNYQKSATIAGKYIDQNFSGVWSNKGMSGLVKFTVNDGALEGNWKKGTDEGPMKGNWTGKLLTDDPAPNPKSPVKKETKANKETKAKVPKVDPALLELKAEIDQRYQDGTGSDLKDEMFIEAMELVIEKQYCSISLLQEKLYVGKNRSQRIIDQLQQAGILGPLENDSYAINDDPLRYDPDVKETIKKVKEAKKKAADEAKEKLRELEAFEKQAAKEAAKEEAWLKKELRELEAFEMQAAKEAAKSAKLRQHKFKSSRGILFCKYCGAERKYSDGECHYRKNGHNFVYLKVDGAWEITCNLCGTHTRNKDFNCS